MPLPATDANGIITEGKFAGLSIDEVFGFAETVASVPGAEPPKPKTAPPANPNPNDTLANAAANRLSPMEQFTFAQFEQQDEETFAASVPDYATFKPKIDEMKKTMSPAQRAQRGFHKFAYQNLKVAGDADLQSKIFGTRAPEPPPPAPEAGDPPTPEAPPAPPQPPAPPAPPTPKPTPAPVAPPTPRNAGNPPAGPKLKATAKVLALAETWGMPINEYLTQLEAQGMTQEDVEALSIPQSSRPAVQGIRSVYDR